MFNPLAFASSSIVERTTSCSCTCECGGTVTVGVGIGDLHVDVTVVF
ncbi:MAG: hypothetical protein GY842_07975 [bacterium]|nr:hypothetical protein [bacterium]